MAIVEKPKKQKVDVEKLINKGGSVAVAQAETEKNLLSVQLRIPKPLIDDIDQLIALRKIKIPRHTWLLEAIHEKIDREQRKNGGAK
ncbi:MAG: hypothetical protein K1Y36_22345 [Blastocatellia bacterium]|nr:hypothetical protein [Blastocatellia bacterium]